MQSIINHYLIEIRDFLPGEPEAVYNNLVRILEKYEIDTEILQQYQTEFSRSTLAKRAKWFASTTDHHSKTLSVSIKLKRAEDKLKLKLLLKDERKRLEKYIKNKTEFDEKYDDYLIILRCIRTTLCNPHQREQLTMPIDLEHARNSADISVLELYIIYWRYSQEAPDAMRIAFETPKVWPSLFDGAGGGLHLPISHWNLDDIYYACTKLVVCLRLDALKIDSSQNEIVKFQYYCLCILYRLAQLTLFPIQGEPMNVAPLRPTSFQVLSSQYDHEAAMREKHSNVSEEVRKHIQKTNEEAMKKTFGDDYKEMLEKDKIGNSRMRSKNERTEEAATFYKKGMLQSIEEQMEIIENDIASLLVGETDTKSLDYDVMDEIRKQKADLELLSLEKKDLETELASKEIEEEHKKQALLKRIYEDETDELPESREDVKCAMTKTGARDVMVFFDQLQFKMFPSLCMTKDWPAPQLPLRVLLRTRKGFNKVILDSVVNVNEDPLLTTAHEWILDHVILTLQQKVGYMLRKNKNKKIRTIDIWKYYTPSDKNPEGEYRIPNWKENITELLSPNDNPNFKDAFAFACDYWLSQHLGKSVPTQNAVFIWDVEEHLFDLKFSVKQFPYVVRIGHRWGVMFDWDHICDAGDNCEDAVIRWLWEIQKRDWIVVDRVKGNSVSLKGTSIYSTFRDFFKDAG
jgi:hypothetical protein